MNTAEYNKIDKPTEEEYEEWRGFLRGQYGTGDLPRTVEDKIFAKAWGDGHSSGYYEVELHFGELAELVLDVARVFDKGK